MKINYEQWSQVVENAAHISPAAHDAAKAGQAAHKSMLTAVAVQANEDLAARAQPIGSSAYESLVSVKTGAAEVADLVRAGRISAAEGRRRLQTLDGQRQLQSQRRLSFEAMAERIEVIDEDPLAAGIEMAQRNTGLHWELS